MWWFLKGLVFRDCWVAYVLQDLFRIGVDTSKRSILIIADICDGDRLVVNDETVGRDLDTCVTSWKSKRSSSIMVDS